MKPISAWHHSNFYFRAQGEYAEWFNKIPQSWTMGDGTNFNKPVVFSARNQGLLVQIFVAWSFYLSTAGDFFKEFLSPGGGEPNSNTKAILSVTKRVWGGGEPRLNRNKSLLLPPQDRLFHTLGGMLGAHHLHLPC